jgi:hypothetical protein
MAKFRIRLKLQGFELEVDGEREDLPTITAALQRELTGLIPPAETFADGNKRLEAAGQVIDATTKPARRSSRRRASTDDLASTQALGFRHDPAKYGNPKQDWSVTDKCIWTLYVLEDLGQPKEVSAAQLTATFNQHFKASGKLHPPNVTRELPKAKVQNPALIGEDKDLWYLTAAGKEHAQELIAVLNPSAA